MEAAYGHDEGIANVKQRLIELEEIIPWGAVKKKWAPRRPSWVKNVRQAKTYLALSERLMMLEMALKLESFEPVWHDRRAVWRDRVADIPPGDEEETLLEAVETFAQGIAWDRIREEEQASLVALGDSAGLFDGILDDCPPPHTGGVAAPALAPPGTAGTPGKAPIPAGLGKRPKSLGKRPRALVGDESPATGPPAKGPSHKGPSHKGAGHKGSGAKGLGGPEAKRTKQGGGALVAQGTALDAPGDLIVSEAPLPAPQDLCAGPPADRLPLVALQVLGLLEGMGLRGQYEGDVVPQLLELVHRHAASVLGLAEECRAHRADMGSAPHSELTSRGLPAGGAAAARAGPPVETRDLVMALQLELQTAEQALPPQREDLVASGSCAINLVPLPLLPEEAGIVLPGRRERRRSLRE
mmetsp:Transcript_4415/g.14720  ORF Transcript_4415/g.14720 Transcript_4415/m.14720 type:complete len:412 (-) Transcript_4415:683-1918(-)